MEFNDLQKQIINSINGAYLISAPVGTGKTTVLAERVITALDSGIKPEEILCLTFTNRAAEEMAKRINKRIGKKAISDGLTLKTFHGFCAYFIKAEAKEIGISTDFVIFDEVDQQETLKRILDNYPELTSQYSENKRGILNLIDRLYDYRIYKIKTEIGCTVKPVVLDEILIKIGDEYISALQEQNALDFNELVILTLKTLYSNEKVRNKWSKRYKFIQLDEFQDTHLSEYLVVKELAKVHKNISFTGDLDQTIYGWRGSEPYFISKLFQKHFAPVKELNLETNYRFNGSILKAVKSFLTSLQKSTTKKIISNQQETDSKCIQVFGGYNVSDEISWVIDNIKNIQISEPKAKIVVLARANYLINQVAEVFEAKKIAHITVDKYDFFRRQEVKDVYAYLKVIFNKFDLESAYRLVLRPARNIGLTTLKDIRERGSKIGLNISDFFNFKSYNFDEPFSNLIKQHTDGRVIVLDTETTGKDVLHDEIIQIYALEIIKGRPGRDFHHYLKNTIPVGYSKEIHGLTDELLKKEGQEPKEILSKLKEFIGGDIVVGHNINFDISMIVENSKRHNINYELLEYYDTLSLSRRFIQSESYKLSTLADLLNLTRATHDAKDDVLATAGLLNILVGKLKVGQKERIKLFKEFSNKFIRLSNLIGNWEKIVKEKRPAEALAYIWEDSGLRDYYEKDEARDRRFKSIETLVSFFGEKDDKDRPADIVIRELIQYSSLVKDINFLGLDQGKVPIVTVHQVKGLEFDYVFIVGVNDYQFPLRMSDNIEEEKRLFYVAMTRARKKIFISYSNFNFYNSPISKSPFIDYIDSKYIEVVA